MFNIFKKKEKSVNQAEIKPKTILCIPGNWNDRTEIVTAIAENNMNDFIFAGMVLLNLKTNKGFELEIYERDDRMKDSFKFAGMVNRIPEDFLEKIDKHKFVVYLSAETGDLKSAKEIAEAGNAILKSGGTGIKVETTGKAFTKEHWTELLTDFKESNLYQMYVLDSISDGKGTTYTCGMHNLGLKDSIVYNEEFQESVNLLSVFGYYQLIDKPKIQSGQTFSTDMDSPVFEINEERNQPNIGDELFENPYGMWKLERKASR
ncbi:uncharacterized protein DUF4261 [Tenacibaculum gallaicum]|uniref:Uncharacterized protein DUF4261 n=1 Tax=Tenacibaculum gallaicum TaxID=561505 RepID=A0A3E0IDD5_9FLAO|nr:MULTISPECIES: DUF4261 domain-containing protein [Tenacibaculum]REH56760.1 uncharacterized protein DUF4261 [Tenacibaculum gallaicum]